MPKPKPDKVIRHEIAFTRPLQEAIESVAVTKSVDNIVRPAAAVGIVTVAGFAVYIGYKAAKKYLDWGSDVFDRLNVTDEVSSALAVMKGEATPEQEANATQMVSDVVEAQRVPGILRPFKYFFKLI